MAKESRIPGRLTTILIVKNEVGQVKRAVDSARAFSHHIIVNDTGSSDGTQSVLDALGVTWFQSAWENDFAKARNLCLEKVKTPWVFWMDADDSVPEETTEVLKELALTPPEKMYGFEVVNTERPVSKEGKITGARFLQIRLFPSHSQIRFQGRVHEQIEPSARALGLSSEYRPLPIYHHGYQTQAIRQIKARRNLELMLQDPKRLAADPSFAHSLGDAYYILEEWEKGIEAYRRTRELPGCESLHNDIYREVPMEIGVGYLKLKRWPEAETALLQAYREKPEKTEAPYHLALVCEATGRRDEALEWCQKVLDTPRPYSGTVNRYDNIQNNTLLKSAELMYAKGDWEASLKHLKNLQSREPALVEPYYWRGKIYRKQGKVLEAVKTWIKGLGLNPAAMEDLYKELLQALEETRQTEMYKEVLRLARDHFPKLYPKSLFRENESE